MTCLSFLDIELTPLHHRPSRPPHLGVPGLDLATHAHALVAESNGLSGGKQRRPQGTLVWTSGVFGWGLDEWRLRLEAFHVLPSSRALIPM